MHHEEIKSFFNSAVKDTADSISKYVKNPGRDFSRTRKIPPDILIKFLVSQGSSSTRNELADFFGFDAAMPAESALSQQRAKLKPEALEAVFHRFNALAGSQMPDIYDFPAADGSTFSFFCKPQFAADDYSVSEGHSADGFYSMHLNAFYNLRTNSYTDAVIQPAHGKNEFRAFCDMAGRCETAPGRKGCFYRGQGILPL